MGRKRLGGQTYAKSGAGVVGPKPSDSAELEFRQPPRQASSVGPLHGDSPQTATRPERADSAAKIFKELRAEGETHGPHEVAKRAGCGWTNVSWLKKRLSGEGNP